MSRPIWEVADILNRYAAAYRAQHALPAYQLRLMHAITLCRTSALGGHLEQCGHCDYHRNSYNSCRNRHCPKCQNVAREQWIERRKGELLPIDYYHVVFTIPEQLNPLALQNKAVFYKLLFDATAATLLTIGRDPKHLGVELGFFSILHTWGQTLTHHPHIHCVVTGGGLRPDRSGWRHCRKDFFLSVKVLSSLFRRLFLEALLQAFNKKLLAFHGALAELASPTLFRALLRPLRAVDWVVYAKAPFGGPDQVVEYLGRYTHRVAISNHRLLSVDDGQVRFQYKQYRSKQAHEPREMTLSADEFIRRFLLHSLPPGFQRIRHYGLLASRGKLANLALCREYLNVTPVEPVSLRECKQALQAELLAPVLRCPQCLVGLMVRIRIYPSTTAPPPPVNTS